MKATEIFVFNTLIIGLWTIQYPFVYHTPGRMRRTEVHVQYCRLMLIPETKLPPGSWNETIKSPPNQAGAMGERPVVSPGFNRNPP
jgi:hypothetical protein